MAITYIKRVTGALMNLVQINTTDSTAIATAAGYITAQAANIIAVNEGPFDWLKGDVVLLEASDGASWNFINAAFTGISVLVAPGAQILSAQISLSQAQVQGMFAAPVQIVPAVANNVIVPVQATLYTNFQTSAFAGGGVVILQYGNAVNGAGTNSLSATIPAANVTAVASQIYNLGASVGAAKTVITNKGLFLSNQTAPFTGGSAASTLGVTVSYYLVVATV